MVKLLPSGPQREALKSTLRRTNEARDYASGVAWDMGTYANKYRLQQLAYHDIKERFSPTAQVVIRLLAKVADAYKLDRRTKRTFRPYGAIAYDDRILRRYSGAKEVSIWTTEGPQRIGFVCEECTRARLASRRGESDLVYRSGKWYLLATVEVEEPPPAGTPGVWLGVDLGVANIASDSDGEIHTSERVEKSRKRYERIRAKLQAAGTKSAKRHLKKLSGKRLRRSQRGRHGKWAFGQLRSFLEYKSRLARVPLVCVDPAHTSQECNECGYRDKTNRRSQSQFVCKGCGHVAHADRNAALNIRSRASGMVPIVSDTGGATHASSGSSRDKPATLAVGS